MSDTCNLVRQLRTGAQYKHALEIMADDIGQWLRDEGLIGHDPFTHNIILGNGDYPTGREIIADAVRKMNEAADRVEELEAKLATARNDALEEAAKAVEVWYRNLGKGTPHDEIRALKSTNQTRKEKE